jgi:hypothetical protein
VYKQGGYEAHMTFPKEHAREVETISEETGWVYSVITGCPLLGQGTYCYLTNYSKDNPAELVGEMTQIMGRLLLKDVPTLRSKVEHIVYDTKTGVNELGA